MADTARELDAVLDGLLPRPDGPEARLFEAMRYAALSGGKRFRPFLLSASAALFGVPRQRALRAGAAVELVHAYSLVHDDLPAMDDDDLRRGRPTCHVQFDEATAILAGDALLTLSFEVMSAPETHPDAAVRCELVNAMAVAVGARGMVGGQMIDLLWENRESALAEIARMESMKTGAMIRLCCEAGAILGGADARAREALAAYARAAGLAFQIADDLLDVEGDESDIGKTAGKDAEAGKATFVALLGVDGARAKARELVDQAERSVEMFGDAADMLRAAANFVVDRRF